MHRIKCTGPIKRDHHSILTKCGGRQKNPCKICFQTVTKNKGLQCQGACKKWAHYSCLGYTPGKIHDIKAGHITIVCPCPACSTEPKEIIVNPPFNCPESDCPANNFPKCESNECPKNNPCCSVPCSLQCECVNPSEPEVESCGKPPPKSVCIPCPPKTCKEKSVQKSKSCSCSLADSNHMACKVVNNRNPVQTNQQCNASSSSDSQLTEKECDNSGSMLNALEQMCQTVTQLTEQIRLIMCKLGTK